MKQFIVIGLVLFCIGTQAQDTTYYYSGWGKPGMAVFLPLDSITNSDYTLVKYEQDKPTLIKHYAADKTLQNHVENVYDQHGNHIAQKKYDNKGQLRTETIFQNDPTEMALFRTVFGPTFSPANSNFMIRREYNSYGRETGYYIIGIRGQTICSRTTSYREDRRKEKEILRDDLDGVVLTERRYKYIDSENRTVLEEFDGQGKMTQRVVLFDQHDIIQE